MKNNEIIWEINIKEEDINKNIRIINSHEQAKKELYDLFNYTLDGNEKEIKENVEIKINNNIISFSYFYKFKTKGKYTIIYFFKNNLTNIECIFYDCSSLTKLTKSNKVKFI